MTSSGSQKRRRRTQLHKSKILVEKGSGLFGAKKLFKLVVEEDSREVPVLQASSERGSFGWWRRGTYFIYGQCSQSEDSMELTDPELGDGWEQVGQISSPGWFYDRSVIYNEHGNAKAVTMYSCTSRTGDLMRMQVALPKVHIEKVQQLTVIICESSTLSRDCAQVVAGFVGNLYWSEDFTGIEPSNCHQLFDRPFSESEIKLGTDDEKSPSESRERSPVPVGVVSSMRQISSEYEEEVESRGSLSSQFSIPTQCDGCGTPNCSCVANVSQTQSTSSGKGAVVSPQTEESNDSPMIYHNKVPVWNPGISAYTLEFCGRALLPSVHNFQLVNDRGDVVLQLGKVKNAEFNMDFGHPLSAFQAFCICLSVIQRTFVWD